MRADRLDDYATDPMAFFQDLRLPIAGHPRFGIAMHGYQREALEAITPCLLALAHRRKPPTRAFWLEWVKGSGKDLVISACILWLLLFCPWAVLIQIGADDQAQAGEVRRSLLDWIRANPAIAPRLDVQRWRVLCPATGAEAEILTSDESSAHGSRPDLLCVNELSHISSEGFAETLADNFTKQPDAVAIFAMNAGLVDSLAWRWREIYQDNERCFFSKMDTTPPHQDERDIEEASRRNPPTRFARLYRGVWGSFDGDFFDPNWITRAIVRKDPFPMEAHVYDLAAVGCDAGVVRDHASIVVLRGGYQAQKIRAAEVLNFPPPVNLDYLADQILAAADRHKTRYIRCDPWQLIGAVQRFQLAGYDADIVHPTTDALTRAATSLMESLRNERLELFDHPLLIEDLKSCRIVDRQVSDITRGFQIALAKNANGHGDRLAAALLCLPDMLGAIQYSPPPEPEPRRVYASGWPGEEEGWRIVPKP
ncbi:MAG: hypothetical protein ACYTG0_37690 [Planctomycetota bacterium]|jgi:hypothetical protein